MTTETAASAWGLLDTESNRWMGTTEGPFRYDDSQTAAIAATLLNERFGWVARILPRPIPDGVNVMRDELTPKRSLREAMQRLGLEVAGGQDERRTEITDNEGEDDG